MEYEAQKAIQESQQIILNYHADLPNNIFTKLINENRQRAFDYVLNCGKSKDEKKALYTTIDQIYHYPKPVYRVASTKTARLYPFPGLKNLTSVAREIRKALTHGCIEADLSCAHLAIIAKEWQIQSLIKLLIDLRRQNASVWQHFTQALGIKLTANVKSVLKIGVYSLCYGGSSKSIINNINKNSEIPMLGELFFALPIMQDILKARETVMHDNQFEFTSTEEWGFTDIEISEENSKRQIRSLLSCQSQAIEQILIAEVYKAVAGHPRAYILVYSFDGVTIHINKDDEKHSILKKLKDAVDEKAKELEIITTLEFEEV
jgi:hypothetical protein